MRLIKIPFNAGALSKKDGQELAPDKIMSFVKDFYANESERVPHIQEEELFVDNSNLEESFGLIERHLSNVKGFKFILGGDHSITYPSFKAFSKRFNNPGMIIFDAHPDVQDDFKASHEDYLRVLIGENILKKENIVLVGLRNWSKEEIEYLKSNKIKYYSMKEMSFEIRREICDAVMAVASSWDGLYLSIDIDVLDPAFAPGTGYAEPGGLSTRDLLYFIHRIKLMRNLATVDLVEVNPKKDINDMTSKVAAKIIVEFA